MDRDDRTNAIGLFNTAQSYWRSAEALRATDLRVTHPGAPITFLFCHCFELYLKAFLRGNGCSVAELQKFSHDVVALAKAARQRGLEIEDHTYAVLTHIQMDNVAIEARYIVTGFKTIPTEDAFSAASDALDNVVSKALVKKGVTARRFVARGQTSPKNNLELSTHEEDELARIEEELSELTEKDRQIIGYLLHHNQRIFDCAMDGGHARLLISRGIVRSAVRPGQVFDAENMPMEIPREIWRILQNKRSQFPYTPEEDDAHPWRVHWMMR
ncbi:MAG TPA: hypothetical protein VHD59_00070 [Pseudolabrys sp.]|nr:hypothetical protein [Pseudolabrys sp.]